MSHTTEQEAESFASLYKTSFGRAMTTTDAKVYIREVRESCKGTNEEMRAAMRVIAGDMLDDNSIHPPTAPALAREIRHQRGRMGQMGAETFEQALDKIAAEPDASLRYSFFCNRGGSDALLDALTRRGVELAIYGPGHPDWAWMQALMADPEWRNLARNMAKAVDDGTHNRESDGERLARRDSGSVAFHAALQRHIAKRAKEGWTPPPMDSLDPAIGAVVASMARAAESFRARSGHPMQKHEKHA